MFNCLFIYHLLQSKLFPGALQKPRAPEQADSGEGKLPLTKIKLKQDPDHEGEPFLLTVGTNMQQTSCILQDKHDRLLYLCIVFICILPDMLHYIEG